MLSKEDFIKQEKAKNKEKEKMELEQKYQEYKKQQIEEQLRKQREEEQARKKKLERERDKARWELENTIPTAFNFFKNDIITLGYKEPQKITEYVEELKKFYKEANKKYLMREKEIQ